MGTWGVGPFDNDDATEWVEALTDVGDDSLLHEALDEVAAAGEGEYVEASWAAVAIAAAEVVAAGIGRPDPGLPEAAQHWIRRNPAVVDNEHRVLALRAVENATSSELRELWQESPDAADWTSRMKGLRGRLE